MAVFHFKRFSVVNERSAMKVNTDGVLLGAAMTIRPSDRNLLDVGTGTGTIALMAAQRLSDMVHQEDYDICIRAIDIDAASAQEAEENFGKSPWASILVSHIASLEDFSHSAESQVSFDHIFSNPPYFEDSLHAPEQRRNDSRHTCTGLSYRELLDFAKDRLSPQGHVSIVLPADTEQALSRYARMCGLYVFRIVRIRTVPRKRPSRIIAEFSFERNESPLEEILTIQNEGRYTQEYLTLTQDFYMFA